MAKNIRKPTIEISFCCNMCDTKYGIMQVDPYDFRLNGKIVKAYLAHVITPEHQKTLPKKYKKKEVV